VVCQGRSRVAIFPKNNSFINRTRKIVERGTRRGEQRRGWGRWRRKRLKRFEDRWRTKVGAQPLNAGNDPRVSNRLGQLEESREREKKEWSREDLLWWRRTVTKEEERTSFGFVVCSKSKRWRAQSAEATERKRPHLEYLIKKTQPLAGEVPILSSLLRKKRENRRELELDEEASLCSMRKTKSYWAGWNERRTVEPTLSTILSWWPSL
jgi:hypothetical protein